MNKTKKVKRFRVTKKSLSVKIDGTPIGLMSHRELCHTVHQLNAKLHRLEQAALRLGSLILS